MIDACEWCAAHGVGRDAGVAVALGPEIGCSLAFDDGTGVVAANWPGDGVAVVARIEREIGPRWVWWDRSTSDALVAGGVRVARSWDVLTVHRLLWGGWRATVGGVWARLHGLDPDAAPAMGQLDLLAGPIDAGDPDDPVQPDGYLRPDWVNGGWATTPERARRWAATALTAMRLQLAAIDDRPDPARTRSTAHAESAAEFLCAELTAGGLPVDVDAAREIIAAAVGPEPRDDREAGELQSLRDRAVLAHLDTGPEVDLRNPAHVRTMLRRVGVDVPNTRAHRLEPYRDAHPLVPALLEWRKAERIATTYGYRWLTDNVSGGRLRGEWSSADGAAGRMTASAGLHNLPSEMRPAVVAEPGHVFVRADLGQIEPRVLAAVSGDRALVAATADDDLYAPIAARLRVTRDVAKVAVLGAMYGSTTGESAHALRGLEREYPVAMRFLADAAAAGARGDDVFTIGGRRIRMWIDETVDDAGIGDIDRARRVAAARGRFARNAVVQGAAAEFFKVWAVVVRTRGAPLDAEVVLCLHDELIVQVPADRGEAAADLLNDALAETAYRWSPEPGVRFVADVSVIRRWSDAK